MENNTILLDQIVVETLKLCQNRREPTVVWVIEEVKDVELVGLVLLSVELG